MNRFFRLSVGLRNSIISNIVYKITGSKTCISLGKWTFIMPVSKLQKYVVVVVVVASFAGHIYTLVVVVVDLGVDLKSRLKGRV